MRKVIVTALLALALVSTANAANEVWWATDTMGAAGTALALEYNPAVDGETTWTVTMKLSSDEQLNAWSQTLFSETEGLSVSNVVEPAGQPFTAAWMAGTAGTSPGSILADSNAIGTAAAGAYDLIRFDLTAAGSVPMGTVIAIQTVVSYDGGGWAAGASYPSVVFGDNDPHNTYYTDYSGTAGVIPNAVITVTAIPEPATLVLLSLGALALIRRR